MTQAFYRKWRPQRWDEVVGQEHVIRTLHHAVSGERVGHAYLFAGPRGTGKTTTARLLAKAVNCLDPDPHARPCDQCEHCQAVNQGRFLDLIEIDAASNTSVEDVRSLRDKINFSPNQGRYKVYIIDEVHMLSTAAFNALLKTLEEPPSHAIFVLATTEVHKIPATILSRCQLHEFRRIPVNEIVAELKKLGEKENLEADEDALTLIARQATGSLRDAISLLDQLASYGEKITLEITRDVLGTATSKAVIELIRTLQDQQPAEGLDVIHRAINSGAAPRQFARQIVDYLRQLLLIRMENASQIDVTNDVRATMAAQAQRFTTLELLRVIRAFNQAATGSQTKWQPALPLELAFIELVEGFQEPEGSSPAVLPPREKPSLRTPKTKAAPPTTPSASGSSLPPEEIKTSPPGEGVTLRQIAANWKTILAVTRKHNRSTQALLNSCKLVDLKHHKLYLGFASDILKTQMEREEHLTIAHQSLEEVLGTKVQIQCIISTNAGSGMPADVDDDGMVAAALRLGGEIVDSQEMQPRSKGLQQQ